jgi:hypothetical protein
MRSGPSRKAESTIEWSHDVLQLTWEEVAEILGTTSRTLQRWREQGTTPLRDNAEKAEKLDELRFWLETVFQGDLDRARVWLDTRLLDLRGKTPMDMIRQQRLDRVIEILATAHEGAFI